MKLSPALAYLASAPWAMEFGLFGRLADIVAAHAAGEKVDAELVAALRAESAAPDRAEPGIQWIGRTAVVPIRGAIARYASSVNGVCQPQGRSAEAIQSDLMTAAERGAERVILRIDSPGGEVAGTAETAAIIRHLSASKIPVTAFVDGMAASAAYWLASQADEIIASSDTAKVGSIGVALTVPSGGGSHTVITSAPAKGGGTNDAQLANARTIVADLATAFADAVAAGRGLGAEQAAALATGELWTAQRAMGMDLIDGIATWDQVIGKVPASAGSADPARRKAIAERIAATITVTQPQARTAADAAESTQAAAQASDAREESAMDTKLKAKLAALCQQHPNHAAALVAEAMKDGATEASIQAHADGLIAKATAEAHAAELADIKAKLAAAEAKATEAEAARAKLGDELKAAAERLTKYEAHVPKHQDPGPLAGQPGEKRKIPVAKSASLTKDDLEDIKAGRAVIE